MRISDWSSDVCSSDLKETVLFIRGKHSENPDGLATSWHGIDHVETPCMACQAATDRTGAHNASRVNLQRFRHIIFRESMLEVWHSAVERTATHPTRSEDEYDYPEELPQVQLNRFRSSRARDQLMDAKDDMLSAAMLHHFRDLALQHSLFEQLWSELRELPTKALRIRYVHPMDDHPAKALQIGRASSREGGGQSVKILVV